jgi:small subunit ribosomal protein S4e
MGKKGGKRHLKREKAPRYWPIHPKESQWAVKPSPGPHAQRACVPLASLLRDFLGYAKNRRESKIILARNRVSVDGEIRHDYKFPTGLMDVVELPDANMSYRILPAIGKGLTAVRIPKDEATAKLCRIEDKTTLNKGRVQLNLHDGRSIVIPVEDARNPKEDIYKTRDTVRIGIPTQKILGHLKFAEGAYAIVTSGRNLGRHGKIMKIEPSTAARRATALIEDPSGNRFETIADYLFVVGEEKPIIKIEGGA